MIFGPGGIGKSPVDGLIRRDALRVDPYRLRGHGPRDLKDIFYGHQNLRAELTRAFEHLGDQREYISTNPAVEWFPKCQAAFFDVRGEWQCLLLGGISAIYAKAEIYAPAVPALFGRTDVRAFFGTLSIVILNPAEPLGSLGGDFTSLKAKTSENCLKRGDRPESIEKRTNSIDDEAAAWGAMLNLGGIEFPNWQFPEYIYLRDQTETLLAARRRLVEGSPSLQPFFKPEEEILGERRS